MCLQTGNDCCGMLLYARLQVGTVSPSDRNCFYFRHELSLHQAGTVSPSDRNCLFIRQKLSLLQAGTVSSTALRALASSCSSTSRPMASRCIRMMKTSRCSCKPLPSNASISSRTFWKLPINVILTSTRVTSTGGMRRFTLLPVVIQIFSGQ